MYFIILCDYYKEPNITMLKIIQKSVLPGNVIVGY